MKKIEFSKEEKTILVRRIQDYVSDELEVEIGQIPAELLLGFFSDVIGNYYYNRGLYDAQAVLAKRMDDVADDIYALEQRTELDRKS